MVKMCSLALFNPPLPPGETTLCESNNQLLSGAEDRPAQVRVSFQMDVSLRIRFSNVNVNQCKHFTD